MRPESYRFSQIFWQTQNQIKFNLIYHAGSYIVKCSISMLGFFKSTALVSILENGEFSLEQI